MDDDRPMRQFLLYVFLLLLPCFVLWSVASEPLARPAVGFVNTVLTTWLPEIVNALYIDGKQVLLMTEFGEQGGRPTAISNAEYRFGFEVNTRILSYSLPFYTALHFATPRKDFFNSYVWGLLVLYPLMAMGLLCLCLKQLMVSLGPLFLQHPNVWTPDPNLIALSYQMSVLIVPTLAPAAIWLWQSRETPILKDILQHAVSNNVNT